MGRTPRRNAETSHHVFTRRGWLGMSCAQLKIIVGATYRMRPRVGVYGGFLQSRIPQRRPRGNSPQLHGPCFRKSSASRCAFRGSPKYEDAIYSDLESLGVR